MRKTLLTGLVLLLVAFLFNACSNSVSSKRGPAKILVLDDGGTEDSLYVVLDSAGFEVTDGGLYYEYTGTDFSMYDLVILLNGIDYGETIEDSIQQAMKDYVTAGGNLLTIEWLLEEDNYDILKSFMPVAYNNDYDYHAETYVKMANHPITAAIPDTFMTYDGWTSIYMTELDDASTECTNRIVLFKGLKSGPAVTMGNLGKGHIIHWAMAGAYRGQNIWSDEVKQIFINIGKFSQ